MSSESTDQADRRRRWRLSWLRSIANLTESSAQERWTDPDITHPRWSFVEFMCMYFDELRTSDYASLIKQGLVTDVECNALGAFHQRLAKYRSPNNDDWDGAAILSDPEWREIVALGVQSKKILAGVLTDQVERDALLAPTDPIAPEDYTWPDHASGPDNYGISWIPARK